MPCRHATFNWQTHKNKLIANKQLQLIKQPNVRPLPSQVLIPYEKQETDYFSVHATAAAAD